jgi:hypothetical protein
MKTFLLYRFARYILCAGTAFEAFRQISRLLPDGIFGIVLTMFFSGIIVLLFDGTAFSYLEQLARHYSGQAAMTKRSIAITGMLGLLAFGAGAAFSLFSVPAVSDAMVEDKSETHKDMDSAKAKADSAFAFILASADADITRLESALARAEEKQANARRDAIRAQGGVFAQDADVEKKNWVWTRNAPYKTQRANVAKAETDAATNVSTAKQQLAAAQQAKQHLITKGKDEHTAGVKLILDAGDATVKTWQQKLAQSNRIVLYVVLAAMLFSIIFLIKMASDGDVPEFKDLPEVLAESYEIALNGLLSGLSMMNSQAAKVGRLGIVSGATTVSPSKQSATGATSETDSAETHTETQQGTETKAWCETGSGETKKKTKKKDPNAAIRSIRSRMKTAAEELAAGKLTQDEYDKKILRYNEQIEAQRNK